MCAITRTIHVIALIPIIGVPMLVTILPDDFLTGPKPVEVEPDDPESKALTIWVPLTPAVYCNRSPFGDDEPNLFTSTTQRLMRRLVQFLLGLNMASFDWRAILCEAARIVGEEFAKFLIAKLMMFLWNKLTAETNDMNNALDITIETTSSVDAELETSVQTLCEPAHSWPITPVEVGLPEPRDEAESPGDSQTNSSIPPNDDLMQNGFVEQTQILELIEERRHTGPSVVVLAQSDEDTCPRKPKLVDERQHTGPPVVARARTDEDTCPRKPKTKVEKEIYIWECDKLTEALTTIATFPVDAQEPSKGLRDRVDFIRAHMSIIKLQARGFDPIREMLELVNQGIVDLTAKADFPVKKDFSDLGKSLAKLVEMFAKECNAESLLKEIEYFEQLHREGTFDRRRAWFRCGPKASRTVKHITCFMENRQEYTEKFLREVGTLSDIYNINREWIMFMTAPRDSFF